MKVTVKDVQAIRGWLFLAFTSGFLQSRNEFNGDSVAITTCGSQSKTQDLLLPLFDASMARWCSEVEKHERKPEKSSK